MIVIFYFSSRPRFGITHKFLFDFIIFKTLHMIEYGILYLLFFRAFYKTTKLSSSKKILYSFLLALFYAVADEFHQLFVPSREGRIRDIIIDIGGITIVYYFVKKHLV
jgi:VanZ family protein